MARPTEKNLTKNKKVTSRDVAALAGVSRSAVSRAFTTGSIISEKTKNRVLAASAKLGYQPNVIARSLITQQSCLIGIVMADWENPFYTMMLKQFSEKFQAQGYQIILATVGKEQETDDAINLLLQYQVDGVLVVSAAPSAMLAASCLQRGIPLVLLNREASRIGASSVICDAADIGRKIAKILLDAGYQRFAVLRGDSDPEVGRQETESIEGIIADQEGARVVTKQTHVVGYNDGRNAVASLMQGKIKPDAIICASDVAARGVLDGALIDLKIDVPEALGVFGFGNSAVATWGAIQLTTVSLPIEEMIDASIDALITRLADPDIEPSNIVMIASIVTGSTVKKVRCETK
jgi:DNA-binding LacI/PurR family transcriptional regulator